MKYIALVTENGIIKGKIRFYCETLDVSTQGFYDYLKRKEKPWKHEHLAEQIRSVIDDECNNTYGRKRMAEAVKIDRQIGGTETEISQVEKREGIDTAQQQVEPYKPKKTQISHRVCNDDKQPPIRGQIQPQKC